jgi:hypothetical protein
MVDKLFKKCSVLYETRITIQVPTIKPHSEPDESIPRFYTVYI